MPYDRNPNNPAAGHQAGGGIASNKCVSSTGYKTEPKAQAARPAEVSFLGQALAFKPDPLFSGPGYNPPEPPPQAAGPGGGRTLYGQGGTQGQHGPVAPGESDRNREAPGSRDILKEYGPESSRPGARNR
jgi:hypothetical protein